MRSLTGTFGPIEIAVPRARLSTAEGGTAEWKSRALRAYQRRMSQAHLQAVPLLRFDPSGARDL